jgi:alkylated DNA repair dioxygenase AlkB
MAKIYELQENKLHTTIRYLPNVVDGNAYFPQLKDLYVYSTPETGVMFGKKFVSSRHTLQIADKGVRLYKYNGSGAKQTYTFSEFRVIDELRDMLSTHYGVKFNFCLVNFYPEDASLSWHSDDEGDLLDKAPIYSMSFGCERRFYFRKIRDHNDKIKMTLGHGSLVTMEGDCQKMFEHCVPKMKCEGMRINLTFRQMKNI